MKDRKITTEDALRMMRKINGGGGASSLTDLGIVATATELNYVKGVTSNIQTQLNGKAASDHNHDTIYSKLGHTHSEYALASHSHSGYAASNHNHDTVYSKLGHTHTEYAPASHSHSNYVDLTSAQTITASKTFNGEQKFSNASYCPTITDSASGVGCAFKASRGLFNEALVDKLIMTSTTGKIPFYKYTGTSGGSMSGLTEVASISNAGLLTCVGIKTTGNINGTNEYLTGSLYVGSKTSSTDGKNGLAFGSSGSVFMQGSNPTINFLQAGKGGTIGAKIFIDTPSDGFNYLKFKADNKYLVFRQAPSTDTNATAYFYGEEDGKTSLGASSFKWYRVYAANSSISTSDKRQKKNIKPLKDVKKEHKKPNGKIEEADIYDELFDRLEPTEYNFIGGDNRKNFGLIAQDVLEAMIELGIGENELDLVHHDTWIDEKTGEEKDAYGIAYENLIPLLIYEVQKLKGKVK